MHLKFETKSNRVKGLSFHPTRPWILASLHNGVIQLWDYRLRVLVDTFEEHVGPVRCVAFHPVQPLFVSGGDDYKINVWNYKKRKCLFTLLGHIDYVRTVQFHPGDCPWILSCSDDQTIRIWNWQSRTCLSVLTGHNHYVMSAQFHPHEDLVVSASIDQSVRVWDISGLRKRSSGALLPGSGISASAGIPRGAGLPGGPNGGAGAGSDDLFGSTDVLVKFVLEAHERGVNTVAFHPSQPLIVSGADDRLVKLWRINETQAWEVDTFKGHYHNVSAVLFHPRYDIVISDSEDKTIRVWDLKKHTSLQTFRRENDRFWALAVHPTQNVIAAGHDSGLVLFKLANERIPCAVAGSQFLYITNNTARAYDIASGRDLPLCTLRPKGQTGPLGTSPSDVSFSPADKAIVVSYPPNSSGSSNGGENGSSAASGQYELYHLPGDTGRGGEPALAKRGSGCGAAFVGRRRFAVLEKGQISVKDAATNAEVKSVPAPGGAAEWLFQGPNLGTVLLRLPDDRIAIFDIQQRRVVAESQVPGGPVRHIAWSSSSAKGQGGKRFVALITKEGVSIADGATLEVLWSVRETVRVKSVAWDDAGVLLYTTLSHLKYMLPQNGDHGTIRAIDTPLYLACVRGNKVYSVDREGSTRVLVVNPTEYVFKLALAERRYADVLRMVREANLIGSALVAYLQQRGFPEIALHFVRDEGLRFDLALECGNIDIALDAARTLNSPPHWRRLAKAALAQGNYQIVEMAYQRVRDFPRLSFLYLVTGNTDKLSKMLKIASARGDPEAVFHNSLYLGDVPERAKVLASAGLPQLAYLVAASHGLNDLADLYAKQAMDAAPDCDLPAVSPAARLLLPPTPILPAAGEGCWPQLNVSLSWQETLLAAAASSQPAGSQGAASSSGPAAFSAEVDEGAEETEGADAWGGATEDIDIDNIDGGANKGIAGDDVTMGAGIDGGVAGGDDEVNGWDDGDELDALKELDDAISDTDVANAGFAQKGAAGYFVPPTNGPSTGMIWCKNSNLAVDNAAAGNVESAARLLSQQIGLINIAPLKKNFVTAFIGSSAILPGAVGTPGIAVPIQRNESSLENRLSGLPAIAGVSSVAALAERLREGYSAFTKGQFAEALRILRNLLHSAVCAVAESQKEAGELDELRGICREYITALTLELKRRELASAKKEPATQIELASYLTHCNLQTPHRILILRSAMSCCFNNKNFLTAKSFASRLLELNPKQDIVMMAQKICQYADKNPSNAHKVEYDERNPFAICVFTMRPIYRGSPQILCPLCGAAAVPEHNSKLCPICQVAAFGKTNTVGYQCFVSN